jgi:hypothetical protein
VGGEVLCVYVYVCVSTDTTGVCGGGGGGVVCVCVCLSPTVGILSTTQFIQASSALVVYASHAH